MDVGLDVGLNVGLNVGLDVGLENKILNLIRRKPMITQKEIAAHLSVTDRTIQRVFKKLNEKNIIERTGGNRFGQWIIKK